MTNPAPETVNPANEAAPSAPASAPAEETVRLRVATPWCTAFNTANGQEGTLTVTSSGTDVPAGRKDDLIKEAAAHGVTLAEVSEK